MGSLRGKSRIIKKLFNRCDEDGTNHQVALQEFRATLLDRNKPSPAECLHGRQMKTTLPAIIKPPNTNEAVRASLQSMQDFCRYDAQAKERSTLLLTQPVWVQDSTSHRWSQGVLKSKDNTPRSYIVETSQSEYRRNRIHLKEATMNTTIPASTTSVVPKVQVKVFINTQDVQSELITPT